MKYLMDQKSPWFFSTTKDVSKNFVRFKPVKNIFQKKSAKHTYLSQLQRLFPCFLSILCLFLNQFFFSQLRRVISDNNNNQSFYLYTQYANELLISVVPSN